MLVAPAAGCAAGHNKNEYYSNLFEHISVADRPALALSANLRGGWSNGWTLDDDDHRRRQRPACIVRHSLIDKSSPVDNLLTAKDDQLENGQFGLQILVDLVCNVENSTKLDRSYRISCARHHSNGVRYSR